jgi:5-methylcytosine-specific restriction endonuclease McrA
MPWKPPALCLDCNDTAIDGSRYCHSHQQINRAAAGAREREHLRRSVGLKRLYDSPTWRNQMRPVVLGRDPFCQIGIVCEGRALSVDVDHIVPAQIYIASKGGDTRYFFDLNNLRGSCHACHAHKTALEQRGLWQEPSIKRDHERKG